MFLMVGQILTLGYIPAEGLLYNIHHCWVYKVKTEYASSLYAGGRLISIMTLAAFETIIYLDATKENCLITLLTFIYK